VSLTGGLTASLTCHLSMGLGGGMAAQSVDWNPGDLTGLAITLLPAESLAAGLLWQNTAETVPAVADGDPVRVAVCPYTGVKFTAPSDAARPLLWEEGSGKWSLAFDGIDDYMLSSDAFASTPNGDYTLAARVRAGGATQYFAAFGSGSSATPLAAFATHPTGSVLRHFWRNDGNQATDYGGTTSLAGAYHTAVVTRSGTTLASRVDGAAEGAGGTTVGTATTTQLAVGAFARTTVIGFLAGRVAGLAIYSAFQSGAGMTALETYLEAK